MVPDAAEGRVVERGLLTNTLSNLLGNFATLGAGFLLTPFILHHLGSTTYGLWILIAAVVGYGGLLDLGIAGAVTKYVAEYREREEMARLQSLLATALSFYCVLGLIAIALSAALAPALPFLFHVSPGQRSDAVRLVLLMGLGLGISLPCLITSAILRGLQRFDLVNALSMVGTLISVVATVVELTLGGGLLGMVAVNIPVTLLMQLPSIRFIHRLIPELRLSWQGSTRSQVWGVVVFSSFLFALNLAGRLQDKTDEIVIAASLPLSSVTPYSLALRLGQLPQLLANQFVKVLLPLASQLHAGSDWIRLRALYIDSTRITLAIFVPIACVLAILARPILTLWVGSAYGRYAYLVVIFVLANLIVTSQFPAGALLQGMARHHLLAVMAFASGVANLILSIVLVRWLGLAGVALGTLIPYAVECFGFVLPYALRVTGVTIVDLITEAVMPAVIPAAPMVLALAVLRPLANSLLGLALSVGFALSIYLVAYIGLGLRDFERQAWDDFILGMHRAVKDLSATSMLTAIARILSACRR